eukprot:4992213-Prymnesium_polylepis.1
MVAGLVGRTRAPRDPSCDRHVTTWLARPALRALHVTCTWLPRDSQVGEGLTRSFIENRLESDKIAGQGELVWPFCGAHPAAARRVGCCSRPRR